MKKIKLYGILAQNNTVLIDDEDYPLLSRYRWNLDTDGYVIATGHFRLKMHRLLMAAPKDKIVDHINRNKLDNRKSNLRLVTNKESSYNTIHKKGKSGYRGVNPANSKAEKWEAVISVNNRQVYLGTYSTAKEAAIAYDKKAKEIRGEFAITNF